MAELLGGWSPNLSSLAPDLESLQRIYDADGQAWSVDFISSGNCYFEYRILDVGTSPISHVGFDDNSLQGALYYKDGSVDISESSVGTIESYTTNDIVCVAATLGGASDLVWFRVNNGDWNDNPLANPVTGTGGFTLPSATDWFAYVGNPSLSGASVELLASENTFVHTPPSGYSPLTPSADITPNGGIPIMFSSDEGSDLIGAGGWVTASPLGDGTTLIGHTDGGTFGFAFDAYGGWRFRDVPTAQGATVTSATLYIDVADNTGSSPYGTIFGVDEDDAPEWEAGVHTPTTATPTTASVSYTGTTSYDVTSIVQEIVNRPGWTPGSSIGFFIDNVPASGERLSAPWLSIGAEPPVTRPELVIVEGADPNVSVDATGQSATG